MDETHTPHLQASLRQDTDRIRKRVREMADIVRDVLEESGRALFERKGALAYSVILRDQKIDDLEQEVDRLCLEFLVRQQPVAGSLRFVYATIKINQELERIGDYATSIAHEALILNSLDIDYDYADFQKLAAAAAHMLDQATKAFLDEDSDLAWETIKEDETASNLRDQINENLVILRERDLLPMEAMTSLMTVARRYERASNQSANICEEALYMCTGKFMKHLGTEVFRVLFVDETNSCTTQIAEAVGNSLQFENFIFSSAGIDPRRVDERTIHYLQDKGIDISNKITKSVEHIPNLEHYHVVIAFRKTAKKVFPPPPTRTIGMRWKVKDPSEFEGTEDEIQEAYENTFDYLKLQVQDLVQAFLGEQKSTSQTSE
jgi:phosphate transport system protein